MNEIESKLAILGDEKTNPDYNVEVSKLAFESFAFQKSMKKEMDLHYE